MTFSEEYLAALDKIFDLSKSGQSKLIGTDYSIPKMFGAWSSIFWALPHLDKFKDLTTDQLKDLIRELVRSHRNYGRTTNQLLRTETIKWIGGILKIKVSVSYDEAEGLYVDKWINNLFDNPETTYDYKK
jgi:hypothetical protein